MPAGSQDRVHRWIVLALRVGLMEHARRSLGAGRVAWRQIVSWALGRLSIVVARVSRTGRAVATLRLRPTRVVLGASLLLTLVTSVVATAFAGPRADGAGCGGVETVGPAHWHRVYRAPLAIGDSTMLLAMPALSREGFSVDAHGCRQYPEALSLLKGLRHARELPRVVVIALGANGEITDSDIVQALQILGARRLLVLVTPRELGGGAGSDAQLVRAEGRRHPQRVRILDWVAYSAGHPSWFEPDGLHLSPSGSAAQARLLDRVVPLDAPPRPEPSPRCPLPPNEGPPVPLTGVSLLPPGGVLQPLISPSRPAVTLFNANPFAVAGVARLREATAGSLAIAATCVSAPPDAHTKVSLTLGARALADLEVRQHYSVRLELVLAAAQGAKGTVVRTYLLKSSLR